MKQLFLLVCTPDEHKLLHAVQLLQVPHKVGTTIGGGVGTLDDPGELVV